MALLAFVAAFAIPAGAQTRFIPLPATPFPAMPLLSAPEPVETLGPFDRLSANGAELPRLPDLPSPAPEGNLRLTGADFAREIDEPEARFRARGLRAAVTVYGSARTEPGSRWYEEARRFGRLVAERARGVAVVTGGGPGIMEAANRGAKEGGGVSVGYNIALPREQKANPYVDADVSYEFQSFETRKIAMRRHSIAHAYFPGGFGTLDELFEVLTLMQTGKLPKAPIVLVGKKDYFDRTLNLGTLREQGLVSPEDLRLLRYAEDAEGAWREVEAFYGR